MSEKVRGKKSNKSSGTQTPEHSDNSLETDSQETFISEDIRHSTTQRLNSKQSSVRGMGKKDAGNIAQGHVDASARDSTSIWQPPPSAASMTAQKHFRHVGVQMTTVYTTPKTKKPKSKNSCVQTDALPDLEPIVVEKPVYVEPPPPKIVEKIIEVRSPTPPPKIIVHRDPWPKYLYIPKKNKKTKDANRDVIHKRYLGQGLKPMRIIELDTLSKSYNGPCKIVDRYIRYAPKEKRKFYHPSGSIPFRAYTERPWKIPDAPI